MGGSFDPPHEAHLKIASAAFDSLGLDEIFFIPANVSPLKQISHASTFEDRLNMLNLALLNFKKASKVIDIENVRGGTSYSIDTAKSLKEIYPQVNFFWIIGADQLENLHRWKNISELSKLVEFACFERPNYKFLKNPSLPDSLIIHKIELDKIDVSSSEIRKSIKSGIKEIEFLDKKVFNYINKNKLYK